MYLHRCVQNEIVMAMIHKIRMRSVGSIYVATQRFLSGAAYEVLVIDSIVTREHLT